MQQRKKNTIQQIKNWFDHISRYTKEYYIHYYTVVVSDKYYTYYIVVVFFLKVRII